MNGRIRLFTYEYQIRAYFKEDAPRGYLPRSYKRKIVESLDEAKKLLEEAKRYYSTYKYLDRVVIEEREVGVWEEHFDE